MRKISVSTLILLSCITSLSCARVAWVEIHGKIDNYERVAGDSIEFKFDDIYSYKNFSKSDSFYIDESGRFAVYKAFFGTISQTIMLVKNDTIVERLVFMSDMMQRKDSVFFKDPISEEKYSYKVIEEERVFKVENVKMVMRTDSKSLEKLNTDRLLKNVEISDSLIIIDFSDIPPPGSKMLLWGQLPSGIVKDTLLEIKSSKIYFDNRFFLGNRFFWDTKEHENFFEGGRFITPYGWFKPFAKWNFEEKSPLWR